MISKHSHQLQSRPPYCVSSYRHRARAIVTPDNYRGRGRGGEGERGRGIEGERGGGGRRVKNVGVYISYRLLMELSYTGCWSYGTWDCLC